MDIESNVDLLDESWDTVSQTFICYFWSSDSFENLKIFIKHSVAKAKLLNRCEVSLYFS